jgi:hypothetical protein
MASAPSNHALSKAPLPSRTLNEHTRQLKRLQATEVEKAEPWLKAEGQRNLCLIFSRPITIATATSSTESKSAGPRLPRPPLGEATLLEWINININIVTGSILVYENERFYNRSLSLPTEWFVRKVI